MPSLLQQLVAKDTDRQTNLQIGIPTIIPVRADNTDEQPEGQTYVRVANIFQVRIFYILRCSFLNVNIQPADIQKYNEKGPDDLENFPQEIHKFSLVKLCMGNQFDLTIAELDKEIESNPNSEYASQLVAARKFLIQTLKNIETQLPANSQAKKWLNAQPVDFSFSTSNLEQNLDTAAFDALNQYAAASNMLNAQLNTQDIHWANVASRVATITGQNETYVKNHHVLKNIVDNKPWPITFWKSESRDALIKVENAIEAHKANHNAAVSGGIKALMKQYPWVNWGKYLIAEYGQGTNCQAYSDFYAEVLGGRAKAMPTSTQLDEDNIKKYLLNYVGDENNTHDANTKLHALKFLLEQGLLDFANSCQQHIAEHPNAQVMVNSTLNTLQQISALGQHYSSESLLAKTALELVPLTVYLGKLILLIDEIDYNNENTKDIKKAELIKIKAEITNRVSVYEAQDAVVKKDFETSFPANGHSQKNTVDAITFALYLHNYNRETPNGKHNKKNFDALAKHNQYPYKEWAGAVTANYSLVEKLFTNGTELNIRAADFIEAVIAENKKYPEQAAKNWSDLIVYFKYYVMRSDREIALKVLEVANVYLTTAVVPRPIADTIVEEKSWGFWAWIASFFGWGTSSSITTVQTAKAKDFSAYTADALIDALAIEGTTDALTSAETIRAGTELKNRLVLLNVAATDSYSNLYLKLNMKIGTSSTLSAETKSKFILILAEVYKNDIDSFIEKGIYLSLDTTAEQIAWLKVRIEFLQNNHDAYYQVSTAALFDEDKKYDLGNDTAAQQTIRAIRKALAQHKPSVVDRTDDGYTTDSVSSRSNSSTSSSSSSRVVMSSRLCRAVTLKSRDVVDCACDDIKSVKGTKSEKQLRLQQIKQRDIDLAAANDTTVTDRFAAEITKLYEQLQSRVIALIQQKLLTGSLQATASILDLQKTVIAQMESVGTEDDKNLLIIIETLGSSEQQDLVKGQREVGLDNENKTAFISILSNFSQAALDHAVVTCQLDDSETKTLNSIINYFATNPTLIPSIVDGDITAFLKFLTKQKASEAMQALFSITPASSFSFFSDSKPTRDENQVAALRQALYISAVTKSNLSKQGQSGANAIATTVQTVLSSLKLKVETVFNVCEAKVSAALKGYIAVTANLLSATNLLHVAGAHKNNLSALQLCTERAKIKDYLTAKGPKISASEFDALLAVADTLARNTTNVLDANTDISEQTGLSFVNSKYEYDQDKIRILLHFCVAFKKAELCPLLEDAQKLLTLAVQQFKDSEFSTTSHAAAYEGNMTSTSYFAELLGWDVYNGVQTQSGMLDRLSVSSQAVNNTARFQAAAV